MHSLLGARQAYFGKSGTIHALPGYERRPSSRAGLFGVIIGEYHTLICDPIDIGGSVPYQPISVGADITGGGFGSSDGGYLPIVKVQAAYPRRALRRRMIGWVIVEFTITEQGTVRDPFVVENCGRILHAGQSTDCDDSPNGIFDSAATKAALKFKYKPKVINGNPVATNGVRNKITFEPSGVT